MKKLYENAKKKVRLNPAIQKARRVFYSPFATTDLPFILTHLDPKATFPEQIYWIEQLFSWVSLSGDLPADTDSTKSSIQVVRIKFLLQVLNRNPVWKTHLGQTLRAILKEGSCLELFSQTGLHQEFGFWGEAADRLIKEFLPTPPNDRNLAEFFARVFHGTEAASWMEEIPTDLLLQVSDLFYFECNDEEDVFTRVHFDVREAVVVLSATVGGVGLSKDLLRSLPEAPQNSPFYRLSFFVNTLIAQMDESRDPMRIIEPINSCLQELTRCREGIRKIFRALEEQGVSVTVVYRLDQLQFAINRLETLLHLLLLKRDRDSVSIIVHFMTELIREQNENRGLMSLFKSNLRLLSKKIVERTGVVGEHYITTTKSEYIGMLKSGLGGGVLTVFTMLLKTAISSLKLPFFWDFAVTGANYAGSFIAIQLCGFTLATKQPSATAAHLAGKLENLNTQDKLDGFIEEFKKISRSQIAAAVGNVGMAIPASAFMFLVFYAFFRRPVFGEEYARYTLASLSPISSLTIVYAALTGVWLWLSGIIGGWVENWIVYRRIPDAIAQNRGLRGRLGPMRAEGLASWLSHHAAGLGSSTALGFLLAGVPTFSRMFGVVLDVRHVTLSTCALTFSVFSLWNNLVWQEVAWASAGILIIGTLNFGVSFYLALTVAARARSLDQSTVLFLLKEVLKKFLKSPRKFIVP